MAVVACTDKGADTQGEAPDTSAPAPVDDDGDGFTTADDCDDDDDDVFPGAEEVCNEVDDDCDGLIDDDDDDLVEYVWYWDDDSDEFGGEAFMACELPIGATHIGGDCDDDDDAVHPDASEVCNGWDDDCDGDVDSDDANFDTSSLTTWYADGDNDTYGTSLDTITACDQPGGYVDQPGDCDDGDAEVNPTTAWYTDADRDGYGEEGGTPTNACEQPLGMERSTDDCNDDDSSVHPGADELCDGLDNDCDGAAAEDEVDDDGDGWVLCDVHTLGWDAGAIEGGGDCDDADTSTYPDAPETCDDGLDHDCDTLADCDDGDCTEACSEDCGDGVDNDADAYVDCEDDECVGVPVCIEDCEDGADNDADGYTDCADDDCDGEAVCIEDCEDGADNDADGNADCLDDECWGEEACSDEIWVMSAETDWDFAGVAWGNLWAAYGYNEAVTYSYGSVYVYGYKIDGSDSFTCSGELFGYSYGATRDVGGWSFNSTNSYGYGFDFAPTDGDGVEWGPAGCEATLPASVITFSPRAFVMYRTQDDGSYYAQYDSWANAATYDYAYYFYGYSVYIDRMQNGSSNRPVTWSGYYTP